MTWRDLQGESQIYAFHLVNKVGLLPLSITNWSLVAAESMIFKQSHELDVQQDYFFWTCRNRWEDLLENKYSRTLALISTLVGIPRLVLPTKHALQRAHKNLCITRVHCLFSFLYGFNRVKESYWIRNTVYSLTRFAGPSTSGADLGGGCRGCAPPPPRDDLRFSNTTGILQKKKLCGLLVLK